MAHSSDGIITRKSADTDKQNIIVNCILRIAYIYNIYNQGPMS